VYAKTRKGRGIDVQPAALDSLNMGVMEPVLAPGDAFLDKYLSALPADFGTIAPVALNEQMAAAKLFILDVREASEVSSAGAIAGSVNIPLREVTRNLAKLPAKDQPIVAVCAHGHRGAMVMMALQMMGYSNVRSLAGGLSAWNAASLPVVK
jgi:rhodanese-related sulfurtransferase